MGLNSEDINMTSSSGRSISSCVEGCLNCKVGAGFNPGEGGLGIALLIRGSAGLNQGGGGLDLDLCIAGVAVSLNQGGGFLGADLCVDGAVGVNNSDGGGDLGTVLSSGAKGSEDDTSNEMDWTATGLNSEDINLTSSSESKGISIGCACCGDRNGGDNGDNGGELNGDGSDSFGTRGDCIGERFVDIDVS
jgi:hypothetical protein